jgi:oligoribonuclease (3'-5' exoribonuclease)
MFTSVVEELIDSGIPITINSICEKLDICPESLRLWGLLPKVKEYKRMQSSLFKKSYRNEILNKVNEILYKSHSSNNQINSEELYKSIGVSRTVLVRNFPDLTKYIHERLLEL